MSERPKDSRSMELSYQHAPIGLCYFDTDLRYVHINDWLAELNGLTVQQHLGQRIDDILPEVAAGVEPQLRRVIETGDPVIRGTAYVETPAHPGSRRHYEHSYHPEKSDDGTVVGLRCVVEDVTEHKRADERLHRSERRFRALVDQSPNAIVAVDVNRRVLLANPAAETLFGYSKEELLGQELEILLPERLREKHADHVRSFTADPQPRPMGLGRDLLARRRDGTEFPVEISLSPIETDQGLLVAATIIDISKWTRAEAALKALPSQLMAAQEEESKRIARELHDDLTQRLAALGIDAEHAIRELDGSPALARGHFRDLQEKLNFITADVHKLSRRLHPAMLDDLGLVSVVRSECHAVSNRYDTEVDFVSRGELTEIPRTVSLTVYRIVQEGLRNAVKHAGAERGRVEITVADDTVSVTVEDDGRGFDPARHEHGLGLASLKERVVLCGGELEVESSPGAGTRLIARMPLEREER